jgi:hypothetical protein
LVHFTRFGILDQEKSGNLVKATQFAFNADIQFALIVVASGHLRALQLDASRINFENYFFGGKK